MSSPRLVTPVFGTAVGGSGVRYRPGQFVETEDALRRATADRFLGYAEDTQLPSSCAIVLEPAVRISFKPRAPSSPIPVMMMPRALAGGLRGRAEQDVDRGTVSAAGGPWQSSNTIAML